MIERLQSDDSLVVAAHRGLKCDYPENTLLAFQKALEAGVDMIEFDLRRSKDGKVMVIHDETVDRTTNGTGKVGDLTLAELKRLDAGGWFGPSFEGLKIPAFAELLELLRAYPEVLLNVEIKSSPDAVQTADQAVALLKEYGYLPRCVFTCFDASIIAYLHDTYGLKTQGFPQEEMRNFVPGPKGTYSKMWAVAMSMKLLSPKKVDDYRQMGLLVWSYCPDDDRQMYYSLGCGVTLVTCNNPFPAMRIRRQAAEAEMNGFPKGV
ncbi:glycerophosphodiester phosphodiesterase [Paenibacillus doosanensis]|uniref:glycerophosphodiester phosphodiesterase family protein n=1 Tax=Paenibacillus doosanensis TaxID=1229154 RepID=UPI00217F2EBA|nr:glycerophosphodiester phosphodiesterase family protein [Paenibacillus doosanensis]MCS7459187.1 glycerophosphodiester phosphodiesterase [Paenibacillus doosanensis]